MNTSVLEQIPPKTRQLKWINRFGISLLQRIKQRFQKGFNLPIAYRLGLTFTLMVVMGIAVLGTIVLRSQTELLRQQVQDFGNTIVSQFARSATEPLFTDDLFTLEVMTQNLVADSYILGAAIYDETGERLFATGAVPTASIYDLTAEMAPFNSRMEKASGETIAPQAAFTAPISFQDVVAGHALVTISTSALRESFDHTMRLLIFATLGICIVAIALAVLMSRRTARPVEALVQAAQAIGSGRYNLRLPRGRDEFGQVGRALDALAQSLKKEKQMAGVLSRLVASDVAQTMLEDLEHVDVGCKRVEASVLFVDIVGYTELAESMRADELVDLLNEYFAYFTLCSQLYFGTVDKFIGDCAMVIFGAPKADSDHRFNAIACASVMMRLLEQLNQRRRDQGLRAIEVRIGINSGEMMAGMFGAKQRMEYTVVGDTVNVASRLGRLAKPGEILVGDAVTQDSSLIGRVDFTQQDEVTLRGRRQSTRIFHIDAIAPRFRRTMDTMIQDILDHKHLLEANR